MLEVGDSVTFSALLYDKDPAVDSTAALVNPASISLTILLDNASLATPVIANPPATTGTFYYKQVAATAGRYLGKWTFTMADGSTSVYTEAFDVQPSDAGLLIPLNAAKQHLNMKLDKHNSDEELRDMIAAITPVIEDYVGALVPRTVTEVVSGESVLTLSMSPVMDIASVTPFYAYGTSYAPSYLKWTTDGSVRLNYGGPYFYGGTFTVTYTVGRKPIPPNVTAAAKIILKHLWETQRGSSGSPYSGTAEVTTDTGYGYAVPNRALELLKPQMLGPSVG